MIVSKARIRQTVDGLQAQHPQAGEAELHHWAAAALGLEAETVRIVMTEQFCAERTAALEN